jgi:two-component system, NtrC family, response regulator PilR
MNSLGKRLNFFRKKSKRFPATKHIVNAVVLLDLGTAAFLATFTFSIMATTTRHLIASVLNDGVASHLEDTARELGLRLVRASHPASADLAAADCVVIELPEWGSESMRVLESCREAAPDVPVIAVLSNASPIDAIRFGRAGGFDCLAISSTKNEFFSAIQSAQAQMEQARVKRAASADEPWRRQLVGASVPMDQITRIIRLVASRRCTVLITGETGTGKEMAARAIHQASNRARKPMVCVNCSAIPENLIEAELFGHVKGAYTGAVGSRPGRFEQANGGTLFLDEIADLPFELQSKLLRALQEKEIQRLGSSETIKVDVRVIAATNADLLTRVQEGRFREDLYYRLNVVPVLMPTLRDRAGDIPTLVDHFVQKICALEGIEAKSVAAGALNAVCAYAWPGNVRQLENVVEHAVVMSGERDVLHAGDFVLPKQGAGSRSAVVQAAAQPVVMAATANAAGASDLPDDGLDFTETLRQFERGLLQQAMNRAQGNKTAAADMLRLPRTTLIHKLRTLEQAVV